MCKGSGRPLVCVARGDPVFHFLVALFLSAPLVCLKFVALYTASNLKGAEDPHYFMQRVGEYDMWAIKYGYMAVEGEEMLTQHKARKNYGHTIIYMEICINFPLLFIV